MAIKQFQSYGNSLFSSSHPLGFNMLVILSQPRSQALSSLPPLVVEGKTLVAAGHVTTRIWVVKNLLGGWDGRVFCLLLWQTLWVSKSRSVAKNYPLYRGLKSNLPIKNTTPFLSSLKHRRPSYTEKFGSKMEWPVHVECHVPNWNEISASASCISLLNSDRRQLIFFFDCAVFWLLKVFLSHTRR